MIKFGKTQRNWGIGSNSMHCNYVYCASCSWDWDNDAEVIAVTNQDRVNTY